MAWNGSRTARPLRRMLVAAAGVGTALAAALPAAATPPGRNGALVFTAIASGRAPALEVLPPGATVPHAVLRAVPDAMDATLSTDGRRIAFATSIRAGANGFGAAEIWTMSVRGGDRRPLVQGVGATSPAWSPDGRTLAYAAADGGIWLVRAGGGTPRRLALRGCPCSHPALSPDGLRIAYESDPSARVHRILVVRLDGRGLHRLGAGREPAWSPAGDLIAFTAGRTESDVLVMRADGSWRHRLVPHTAAEEHGASFAGFRDVLVQVGPADAGRLEILDVRRQRPPRLLPITVDGARFAPDGRILYTAQGAVHLVAGDGTNDVVVSAPLPLAPFDRQLFAQPTWSADGRTLAFGASRLSWAARTLTRAPVAANAVPSPDGTRVAWTYNEGLIVADASGANPVVVAHAHDGAADTTAIAWSPDGTRIADVRHLFDGPGQPANAQRLEVVDVRTGAVVRITPAWQDAAWVDWSPDGAHLVYAARRRSTRGARPWSIWTAAAAGGERTRIVARGVTPSLSPDGATVVYASGGTLRALPAAGGASRILARVRRGRVADPAWQPLPVPG